VHELINRCPFRVVEKNRIFLERDWVHIKKNTAVTFALVETRTVIPSIRLFSGRLFGALLSKTSLLAALMTPITRQKGNQKGKAGENAMTNRY